MPELTSIFEIPIPFDTANQPQLRTALLAVDAVMGGLSENVFRANSYTASVVTVPAPAIAPAVSTPTVTLGTFGIQPGNAAFTPGDVYEVAITFNGKTGESLIGTAVASFTAATGQGLTVHPNAPTTTLAASANIYIKDTSGVNTWRRASDASGEIENNNCGFGDGDSAIGGMAVKYNAAGATPPGASTATKPDGTTALGETPALAPTLKTVTALLSGLGALYFSYSWVTENGETALSPFSSSVTAPSAAVGAWMPLFIAETPPAGAVAIRIYAGTAATEAAMKLQAENPIWWVRHPIHSFNSSGAAHVTATPTSTLSSLQLAYNAALVLGGGTVIVPADLETKVPLIFGNPTSNKFAIRITGEGGNNASYDSSYSKTRVDYTGSKTDATLVLVATSSLIIENIDFADPNGRVKYAHATSDFAGGQGHNNRVNSCTFRAMQAGGIGILSKTNSGNLGTHTSDNCVFDQVTVFVDAWAVDLAGNQTLEYQFYHLGIHVFNSTDTANSGVVRAAAQTIEFDGVGGTETGHYFWYLTSEYLDPLTTSGNVAAKGVYDESVSTRKFLYASPLDINGSGFLLTSIYRNNQSGGQTYGYLLDNRARGQTGIVYRLGQSVYNYSNSIAGQVDEGLYPGLYNGRPPWGTRGTSAATYLNPIREILSGALGLRNATNLLSVLATDAAGNLVLDPATATISSSPVGIGTTSPQTKFQVGTHGSDFLDSTVLSRSNVVAVSQNQSATANVNAAAEPVLTLHRRGDSGLTYPQFVEFRMSRYATNDASAAFTQLDIAMNNGSSAIASILPIMTLRGNGNVGIGTTGPTSALHVIGGQQIGSPTGGDMGAGTLNVDSNIYIDGIAISVAALPSQTTHSGKYLTTDGTNASWGTVAGLGDALVANPLSQFAATTSAQLLGVISDETGSGLLVFNTSPTLVTPVLGVAIATNLTAVNLYGGTGANDDLTIEGTSHATKTSSYVILQPTGGNVGIGTTAPNGLLTLKASGSNDTMQTFENAGGMGGRFDWGYKWESSLSKIGVTDGSGNWIYNFIYGASNTHSYNFFGTGNTYFAGPVGIGTSPTISGTGKLHMAADTFRLDTARTPASAAAAGNAGEICWDATYFYACIANATWRRVAHATW